MSTADGVVQWSGYGATLVGLLLAGNAERRVASEKRKASRLVRQLEAADAEIVRTRLGQADVVPSQRVANTEQVRGILIHAAAGNQPLSVAQKRSERLGATPEDVVDIAESLRESGLLAFEPPATAETRLQLNA